MNEKKKFSFLGFDDFVDGTGDLIPDEELKKDIERRIKESDEAFYDWKKQNSPRMIYK